MQKLIGLFTLSLTLCTMATAHELVEPAHSHTITDLEEFSKLWAHAAVTDLSQQELELLGTFLYYDMASSYYELALRSALLDLQRGSQILSFKIVSQNTPEESLAICAQLNALLERLQNDLAPSRNYFLSVWQTCDKEISESKYQTLTLAIENLKQLGQRALNNWAATNKQQVTDVLAQNSQKLEAVIQKLSVCKNSLIALAQDQFPLDTEAEFLEIQTIHHALGISHVLYEALFHAGLATDEVMGISFGLINLNAAIFSSLYRAFFEALEEKNLIPMHIVIDQQGFIPAESRNKLLPKFSLNNEVVA